MSKDYKALPVAIFPMRLRVPASDAYAHHSGEIGGVEFKDGVSVGYHTYKVVSSLTAGFGPMEDFDTGMMLSPLYERERYMVDEKSQSWFYGQPMPENKPLRHKVENPTDDMKRAATTGQAQTAPSAADDEKKGLPEGWDPETVAEEVGKMAGKLDEALDVKKRREVLTKVLASKGARYLRQVCQDRDLPTARAGEEMVETLAKSLTMDEAKALL